MPIRCQALSRYISKVGKVMLNTHEMTESCSALVFIGSDPPQAIVGLSGLL